MAAKRGDRRAQYQLSRRALLQRGYMYDLYDAVSLRTYYTAPCQKQLRGKGKPRLLSTAEKNMKRKCRELDHDVDCQTSIVFQQETKIIISGLV
eukprot:scaffold104111_cov65-Attheya_sp.AAC.7